MMKRENFKFNPPARVRGPLRGVIVSSLLSGSLLLVDGCPRQVNNQQVRIDLGKELESALGRQESPKQVRSVTVFPDQVSLNIGETRKLTATVKYSDDTTGTGVTWDNPDNKVVSVSPDGTLLALSNGQVTLTALAGSDAEKRGSVTVTVNSKQPVAPSPTINPNFPVPADKALMPGKAGYAIQLNGIDSFITIPSSDLLNVTSALTIEAWININKFSQSQDGAFFPVLLKGSQNIRYGVSLKQDNTLELSLDNKKILIPDQPYSFNTWYHLALTWDGSAVNLYRNGVLTASAAYQYEMLSAGEASTLYLGADLSGLEKFADGLFDNVRIWNYALSQAEIRENMHLNLKGDELGLVGYWRFDEGAGNLAADFSASRSRASLVNRSIWVLSSAPVLAEN